MSDTPKPQTAIAVYRNSRGRRQAESPAQAAYLSTADVGVRLRFHIESVRRMIRDGRLPAIRIGKRLRVPRGEIEAIEASQRVAAGGRGAGK